MAEATPSNNGTTVLFTPASPVSIGQMVQVGNGSAGYAVADIASGSAGVIQVLGQARLEKTTNIVILDGGEVWWDASANKAHYKPVNDADFYVGVAVGNAAASDTIVEVRLNVRQSNTLDLLRDMYREALTGTLSLTGLRMRRNGGGLNLVLSSMSEAQKLDALGVPAIAAGTPFILEFAFTIPNGGAGSAPDFNIGIANGTHATDADSITNHLFCHIDGNSANISFQSKDGTTTVTATDSTKDYTAGSDVAKIVTVWIDGRNPADCQVYVNAENVLPSTVFDISAATGPWQLLAHLEKTSAADVFEGDLHYARLRTCDLAV